MSSNLPYVASPGSIKTALVKIRAAATPTRVTTEFVNTVLQIKGGTGGYITPLLKRIGFVASDGTPTERYRQFRNPDKGGSAMADAIRFGYRELVKANEYFHQLSDKELLALIVQVTGVDANNRTAALTLSTLKALKDFADFNTPDALVELEERPAGSNGSAQGLASTSQQGANGRVGLNLSYTINLNLPATADQAVFNAIFRSLKEHLLSGDE
jgi:hypothetical protein